MPLFEYSAIDAKSEVTEGKIEAANPADATNQLRASGPVSYTHLRAHET